MSYTEMLKVRSGGLDTIKKFPNAHGAAPAIWGYVCQKYMGDKYWWLHNPDNPKFWGLARDENIPTDERVALIFTFDQVIVRHENFKRVGDALRTFSKKCDDWTHLPAIADELYKLENDQSAIGCCWVQTSVSSYVWTRYDECDKCGQQLEDGERMFDIGRDNDYFFLFDEYPELLK